MKTTCIITSYNYCKYICESIESAINQTVRFDEIIIVDDNSDDGSIDLIKRYSSVENIFIVTKAHNSGQLGSFNIGIGMSKGDIIFFLDADDIYASDYLESCLAFYQNNIFCDFLFCAHERFGLENDLIRSSTGNYDFGFTVALTYFLRAYVGSVTSTISIRKRVLDRFMPLTRIESDWVSRADDCLVWGSSLSGARKYYLDLPLVRYRVHENNGWYGKQFAAHYSYKRGLAVRRLLSTLCNNLGIDDSIVSIVPGEISSRPHLKTTDILLYFKVVNRSKLNSYRRIRHYYKLLKVFLQRVNFIL